MKRNFNNKERRTPWMPHAGALLWVQTWNLELLLCCRYYYAMVSLDSLFFQHVRERP
jgi:hypothetical protein